LEEELKPKLSRLMLLTLALCITLVSVAQERQEPDHMKAVQVIGLAGVKKNTEGSLNVENGNLTFVYSKTKCNVATASIQQIITGNDSQRMIGGTLGTISMLAPYGGGRALSLLRNKIDVITIEYRDANGGLHGAIFTLAVGNAEVIKEKLIAQGAHTSLTLTTESASDSHLQPEAQEQHR